MKQLLACIAFCTAIGGCTASGSLGAAADRLDASAHRYFRQVYASPAPEHATRDAAQLAEAARDFHREVDRRPTRETLRPSFDRVAERYHHVRRALERGRPDGRYGFERVTEAYLDVDRAMNHPESRFDD